MGNRINDLESQCKKSVEHFKTELSRLRTGRASGALLEGVKVDYYGTQTPLIQMGSINVPEPRTIAVQVYDAGAVDSVEKAIRAADLGLNPQREGNLIRVNIPALTQDRRKELIKKVHETTEAARVGIRNHRRDTINVIKDEEKGKKLSQDESRREQEGVEKIVAKYIKEIDALGAQKEKEMMEV